MTFYIVFMQLDILNPVIISGTLGIHNSVEGSIQKERNPDVSCSKKVDTAGDNGTGPECLAEPCWRPCPRRADEGFD